MTSCPDEIVVSKSLPFWILKEKRYEEYAARLPPVADQDLSPTLRPFTHGEQPGLLFGFECPYPEKDPGSTIDIVDVIAGRIRQVNVEVEARIGREWRLRQVMSVTSRAAASNVIVVAFYWRVDEKLKNDPDTKEKTQKVHRELCSVFGEGVKGPEWHWDSFQYGADVHAYIPFDEAYPQGYPTADSDP